MVLDTGDDDFVAAPVTSQSRAMEHDWDLEGWRAAGLNVSSTVRLHKLAVLAKTDIVRTLGQLSDRMRSDSPAFCAALFVQRLPPNISRRRCLRGGKLN